jgi:ubiquinone/menaquinone biosynthesis C-methylase UbiE
MTIDFQHPSFPDFYDELPLWSAPFGLLLLDRVPLRRGMTVLDIGCGTGFLTVELAQRCGSESRVIAVDPWAVAVERLRRKIAFYGLGNVTVTCADAATLDLPDDSVDLIVCSLGINNFEDAPAVLRECRRVAKPQASLCLTTNTVGHMAELYAVYRDTLIQLDLDTAALERHEAHRGTQASTEEMFSAGIEVVETAESSFRLRYLDGTSCLDHWFIRLGFLPAWRAVVPEDRAEEVLARLEKNLNRKADEEGELVLTIPMLYIRATNP